jgi:hypothetical protein
LFAKTEERKSKIQNETKGKEGKIWEMKWGQNKEVSLNRRRYK